MRKMIIGLVAILASVSSARAECTFREGTLHILDEYGTPRLFVITSEGVKTNGNRMGCFDVPVFTPERGLKIRESLLLEPEGVLAIQDKETDQLVGALIWGIRKVGEFTVQGWQEYRLRQQISAELGSISSHSYYGGLWFSFKNGDALELDPTPNPKFWEKKKEEK